MPLKLGRPALLSMEMQRGVVGDRAVLPQLRDAVAEQGIIPNLARLMKTARANSIPVFHCNAAFRADLNGTGRNAPLLHMITKNPAHLIAGTDGVDVHPDLGLDPGDIVIERFHGLTPFTSTSLDQMLRNMGVNTVIATGVSLNFGVMGMCLSAVDLGYRVIVPRDCVAGSPAEYGDAILQHSLAMITNLTDSHELCAAIEAWSTEAGKS